MAKGTPSFGRKNKKSHTKCRRCGRHTMHVKKKVCSACGFGNSAKTRSYSWQTKTVQRDRRK